jgi:hypothetical protein
MGIGNSDFLLLPHRHGSWLSCLGTAAAWFVAAIARLARRMLPQ